MTAGAADYEACPLGVNPDDRCEGAVSGFVVREMSLSQLILISCHSHCDLKLSPLYLQKRFIIAWKHIVQIALHCNRLSS